MRKQTCNVESLQGFKQTSRLLIRMAFQSGFYNKPLQQTSLQDFESCNLNIVYVFVLGDQGTGKTTLIYSLAQRLVSDPLLPSFQYVSEGIRITELGMVTLRLLELNKEHLTLPEISQICRTAKHVFLFVYAIDDLDSLRCLYRNWIIYVRNALGRIVTTVMLGNKIDRKGPGYKVKRHALAHCYKAIFKVNYVFECSALTGYQLDFVFYAIAMLGNKHHCHQKLS
ncbi:hypothetical protein CEXT_579661 [Caerostris extrusa]|uniref:Uncharacterized protein n=1 Tax=Caerostris extrusa TaxID=172846 RepID=A0AAV4SL20_CAEEX|nr:hypothetical protein CEXT_579661 [Caerostris extrusa]